MLKECARIHGLAGDLAGLEGVVESQIKTLAKIKFKQKNKTYIKKKKGREEFEIGNLSGKTTVMMRSFLYLLH